MKKQYEAPEAELLEYAVSDIVSTEEDETSIIPIT